MLNLLSHDLVVAKSYCWCDYWHDASKRGQFLYNDVECAYAPRPRRSSVHPKSIIFAMRGIPLNTATIMSTALEAILYGEYCDSFVHPITTKLKISRLFSAHVYH